MRNQITEADLAGKWRGKQMSIVVEFDEFDGETVLAHCEGMTWTGSVDSFQRLFERVNKTEATP